MDGSLMTDFEEENGETEGIGLGLKRKNQKKKTIRFKDEKEDTKKDEKKDIEDKDSGGIDLEDVPAPEELAPERETVIDNSDEFADLNAMRLEEIEIAKLDLHSTRMQLQIQIKEKLNLGVQLLGIKYQEERSMIKVKMMGCENSRIEARDDYNMIIKQIEERFGIKMSEYIVSDDGTLTHEKDIG